MDLPGDDLVTVVAGGVPVVGTVDEQEDVDDISVDGGHRTGDQRYQYQLPSRHPVPSQTLWPLGGGCC